MKKHPLKSMAILILCLACLASCISGAEADGKVKSLKILTPSNTALKIGETLSLELQVKPDGADPAVTWSSSDPAVAEVDDTGAVTAKSPGKVKITAAAQDGSKKKAAVSLTVPSLYCNTTEIVLDQPEGASFTVDYYGKDWDRDVTVSTSGKGFNYAAERDGNRVTFRLGASGEGKGTLTIKDKKDPKSTVTVNVTAKQSAVGPGCWLEIKSVKAGKRGVDLTIRNNAPEKLYYITVKLIPRDKNGDIRFRFGSGLEENQKEITHVYISTYLKPGESSTWHVDSKEFPDASQVDAAVCYFRLDDGSVYTFAENNLRWFSSGRKQYINNPAGMNTNSYPGSKTEEKGDTVRLSLGIKEGYEMASWSARRVGFRNGGWLVQDVAKNSIAANAGLQANDLITAVNGVSLMDDNYILTKAAAELGEGEPLTLTVERRGNGGSFEVQLAQTAKQAEAPARTGMQTAETAENRPESIYEYDGKRLLYYDDGGDSRYASPYDDRGIGKLTFVTPEDCGMISRNMVNDVSGKVRSKEMSFNKYGEEGWKLTVTYKAEDSLDNYNLSVREGETDLGAWDAGGASFRMKRKNGMITGYAQYGKDTYRLSFIYDRVEDEEELRTFTASFRFGDKLTGAENNLRMGNLDYQIPKKGYDSVFSQMRVMSDGSIDYMSVRYDFPAPDNAEMIYFRGATVDRWAKDGSAATTVNGYPAVCLQKEYNEYYYFGRPEGVYEVEFQLIQTADEQDKYRKMKNFCNDLLDSISFK